MTTALNSTWGGPDFWLAAAVCGTNSQTLTSKDLGTQYNGIAMTWCATQADTITDIGFHQSSMTGTPGAGSYSVALFPLTTGGLPNTGATFANATLGSVTVTTFTPAAGSSAWKWVNLGANTYTVTAGQEFAIVVWRNAATDAGNKITADSSLSGFLVGMPVSVTCTAGTWAKTSIADPPFMGMKSASNVYGRPFTGTAPYVLDSAAFGGTTETGMIFTIPTNFGSTVGVKGLRALIRTPDTSATSTLQANLYSSPTSSPVQLAKTALVVNDRYARNGTLVLLEMTFTTVATLTTGVQYGLGFSTNTSADNATIYNMTQVTQADFDAWSYRRQTQYATRTASSFAAINSGTATGNFSGTTTLRPAIELILDDITAPSGGGGGGATFNRIP